MQTLTIIGAGRLGQSLGYLAQRSGQYRLAAVVCRQREHAEAACRFMGGGTPCLPHEPWPAANLVLLAVPDGAIATVAQQLAVRDDWAPDTVVFHASGAGEAALLAPLAARGGRCASLHPAFSFADPARAVATFAGTHCALEGDAAAFPVLHDFAAAIGGVAFALAPGGKAAYHAALSVASNYLVTLHDLAARVAAQAGMSPEVSSRVLGQLMRQTLDNTLSMGPKMALTGPVSRGDAGTVARHRAVLSAADDVLYCRLGMATLALAQGRLERAQHAAVAVSLGVEEDASR